MKITNDSVIPKYNIRQNITVAFRAGFTKKMQQEVFEINPTKISEKLAKKGIPTDFKENKIIAWSCYKAIEILQQINNNFNQKLSFPKGIYVEDFNNLYVEDRFALGTCNLLFSKLRKDSNEVVPSRTVFFNSIHNWDDIDSISDNQYAAKHFSTDFFLYPFLHEFLHVIHEDRLLNKLGGIKLKKILEKMNEDEQLQNYRKMYGSSVRQICNYAENTPLDAVACDMSRVISGVLDKETLIPTRDPFIDTPYEKQFFWQKKSNSTSNNENLYNILKKIWNGKFD